MSKVLDFSSAAMFLSERSMKLWKKGDVLLMNGSTL